MQELKDYIKSTPNLKIKDLYQELRMGRSTLWCYLNGKREPNRMVKAHILQTLARLKSK